MTWQKIIEISNDDTTATVKSKAEKKYQVTIWDDVETENAKKALKNNEEVWGNITFGNHYGYRNNVALLEKIKIGKWE